MYDILVNRCDLISALNEERERRKMEKNTYEETTANHTTLDPISPVPNVL